MSVLTKVTGLGGPPSSLPLALEVVLEAGVWPPADELEALASEAIAAVFTELQKQASRQAELSIVFSDDAHVRRLNAEWRGKDKPTNVLSFPAMPFPKDGALPPLLGDIVLAFETVAAEARLEGKPLAHHIAHLIAHGLLHLLGFDHEAENEAEAMEALERRVLARLAIPDPYA